MLLLNNLNLRESNLGFHLSIKEHWKMTRGSTVAMIYFAVRHGWCVETGEMVHHVTVVVQDEGNVSSGWNFGDNFLVISLDTVQTHFILNTNQRKELWFLFFLMWWCCLNLWECFTERNLLFSRNTLITFNYRSVSSKRHSDLLAVEQLG